MGPGRPRPGSEWGCGRASGSDGAPGPPAGAGRGQEASRRPPATLGVSRGACQSPAWGLLLSAVPEGSEKRRGEGDRVEEERVAESRAAGGRAAGTALGGEESRRVRGGGKRRTSLPRRPWARSCCGIEPRVDFRGAPARKSCQSRSQALSEELSGNSLLFGMGRTAKRKPRLLRSAGASVLLWRCFDVVVCLELSTAGNVRLFARH